MEGILKILIEVGGIPALAIFGLGFVLIKFKPEIVEAMKKHTTVAEGIRVNVDTIKENVDRIRKDVDRLIESDLKQEARLVTIELEQAKANVYSEALPVTERIWNAHRYLRCGGNSDTSQYVRNEMARWPEFAAVWKIADQTKGKVDL